MKLALAIIADETGASAAEYALIIGIVGTGIALAAAFLGNVIFKTMSEASVCIQTRTTC